MCTLCVYVHCVHMCTLQCEHDGWLWLRSAAGEPLREGLSIRTHFFVQLFNAFRQYPCHPGFVDKERNYVAISFYLQESISWLNHIHDE